MKNNQKIIAQAKRIEVDSSSGKTYIVFEIIDEQYKQSLKKDWINDIEFIILDKNLVLNEE